MASGSGVAAQVEPREERLVMRVPLTVPPSAVLVPEESMSFYIVWSHSLSNMRPEGRASSKVDGKKRAVEEDEEATATEEEATMAESPPKRRKKQVK
jgi:hypothetical protein